MSYLIVIIVVLVALAPLWQFMPTKSQRRVAKLRETAALEGLFVEFRDLPLAPEKLTRLPASERQVLYYGIRLKPSRGAPRARRAWVCEKGLWRSEPLGMSVSDALSGFPDVVLAASISEASCGVFWREEGDENLVRDLAALLKDWSQAL
ncbi:MAG: hypothetical protein AAGG55_03680 [Pseudomonadota bacterium]